MPNQSVAQAMRNITQDQINESQKFANDLLTKVDSLYKMRINNLTNAGNNAVYSVDKLEPTIINNRLLKGLDLSFLKENPGYDLSLVIGHSKPISLGYKKDKLVISAKGNELPRDISVFKSTLDKQPYVKIMIKDIKGKLLEFEGKMQHTEKHEKSIESLNSDTTNVSSHNELTENNLDFSALASNANDLTQTPHFPERNDINASLSKEISPEALISNPEETENSNSILPQSEGLSKQQAKESNLSSTMQPNMLFCTAAKCLNPMAKMPEMTLD